MATTLAQLRTRAQRLADMENSGFVADAEWNDYLNEGLGELHDLVVSKYEDYLLTSTSINIVAGTAAYSLPADFLKEAGVDLVSGGITYTLHPYVRHERNRRQFVSGLQDYNTDLMFHIEGQNIRFIPSPSAAATATLWYIPQLTKLTSDSNTVNASMAGTWERYAVIYAAMKAKTKEESDTSQLERQLDRTWQLIQAAASNRHASEGMRVVDVKHGLDDLIGGGY